MFPNIFVFSETQKALKIRSRFRKTAILLSGVTKVITTDKKQPILKLWSCCFIQQLQRYFTQNHKSGPAGGIWRKVSGICPLGTAGVRNNFPQLVEILPVLTKAQGKPIQRRTWPLPFHTIKAYSRKTAPVQDSFNWNSGITFQQHSLHHTPAAKS